MLFAAIALPAEAQQPTKVPRIGYLGAGSPSANSARIEAFRQGLRELGYVEGKNIVIEWRYAEGKLDRLPALAAELVRLKVDVIVTGGPQQPVPPRKQLSRFPLSWRRIAILLATGSSPALRDRAETSLDCPTLAPELSGKQLELLKEIVPKLSRVAVFGTSTNPGNAQALREMELAAEAFRVKLQYLDVLGPKDIETAFRAAARGGLTQSSCWRGPVLTSQRTQIVELAAKSRLPAIYSRREYVEAGGLMSYGVNVTDLDRRAATYVDKILKGAKPADLPVEQPTKFELVINLKAAKQIGLTIPPNVLARADKVIK